MISILSLWLPILLSAVFVFIASSIIHMVLTHHRSDYKKLPDEQAVVDVLRKFEFQPGNYYFPHVTNPKEMKSPDVIEKFKRGPVGMINFRPNGAPSLGKHLSMWFLYCLLIGVFVAYLASRTHAAGVDYRHIFRFAGAVAFMGYSLGEIMDAIWKGQTWGSTIKYMFDGLIYSLLTAGTFGWLWPR